MNRFLVGLLIIFGIISCKQKQDKAVLIVSKDATLRQLDSVIKLNPKNSDAYYKRANFYLSKMNLGEATEDINKAIELDSTKSNYYVTVADLHLITNNSGKCKAALDKCLSVDSNNIEALLKMSELYLYVKENIKSISYANKVLDREKSNSKAYFLIGMNQKEIHDTTKALLAFQEAINYNQENYNAFIQLGLIYAAKNNPMALNYYTNASNIDSKNPEPYYNKGVYYQEHGNLPKSIECYNQTLQINPTNKGALYNIGIAYIDSEMDYANAATYFKRIQVAYPNFAEAHYMHGVCQEKIGNKKEALEDYKKALAINESFEKPKKAIERLQ